MGNVIYFPTGNARPEDPDAYIRRVYAPSTNASGVVCGATNPVAVLEYFLALAKQDKLRFLAIAATLVDGRLLTAELGRVDDEGSDEDSSPEEPA